MAIKSVWIEEDCIACGTCEGICPEVFQVTDRSRVKEGVDFNDYCLLYTSDAADE